MLKLILIFLFLELQFPFMNKNYKYLPILNLLILLGILTSCEKVFEDSNYVAYFGGEIINPQSNQVIFLKNGKVIDTIYLDENNRFLHKFDSLAPGLYTFQHLPEYQYIYFDKNDSLMIRLNSLDFDNSLAFCGRGDEKNNFLIDQFLKNENEHSSLYSLLEKEPSIFINTIDSLYKLRILEYEKKKEEINWSNAFDSVAKAGIDFSYYHKKELYPLVHQYRTGNNVYKKLPNQFYEYRKALNYNNKNLSNFSPFIKYITSLLNNKSFVNNNFQFDKNSLESNVYKLDITDSLIKENEVKNVVLNNIAYMYLLEDQNMFNNKKFIDRYLSLSTDKDQQESVKSIYDAVQNLKIGNTLPHISLIDQNNKPIEQLPTNNKKTVVFFWTTLAETHLKSVHKKIIEYKEKYPEVNFIGININDSNESWNAALNKIGSTGIIELKSTDFQDIRKKWVITKVHRTILLNPDGTINNAFANIYDSNFTKQLEN